MRIGRDRGLGLLMIALGLAYGFGATRFDTPFGGGGPIGPQTFPLLLSGLAVAIGLGLSFSGFSVADWPRGGAAMRVGLVFATFGAFAALLQPLGFPISAALCAAALVRTMGAAWREASLAGPAIAASVYLLFDLLLGLALPRGVMIDRLLS